MWSSETSNGYEAQKCRHRIVSYCKGMGLDLGAGNEKIVPTAIGIDGGYGEAKGADMTLDLSANQSLGIFSCGYFDYVFSSHLLEDFSATESILKEWWRVIKAGGHLVLYGPDPDYYPRVGTAGANPNHKQDLYWEDVWKIVKGFGNAKLIQSSRHNDSNEYSWQIVCQKVNCRMKRGLEILKDIPIIGKIAFPRIKKTKKECLIIRYGAIGDAVWATTFLPLLKKQGYYIVYNTTPYSQQVLMNNPNIDEFLIQSKDAIPNEDLSEYWKEISKGFEKVINLSQSVESSLLRVEGSKEYKAPQEVRHSECNVNYYDRTLEIAGYKDKGKNGELYFTEAEENLAKVFREKHKDKFIILWSLSGSSFHKVYPYTEYVASEIIKKHDDVKVITVGDEMCRLLEWENPNVLSKSGKFTVRQSMILTKYSDLVVGTETGILNAAGCFDTPKIIFLSHSSPENICKYWKNCTPLWNSRCECQPCHRLIYTNSCPKGDRGLAPKCMEDLKPEVVITNIEIIYNKWKRQCLKLKQEVRNEAR